MDKGKRVRGNYLMDSKDSSLYQIALINREALQANGVLEVESFNEQQIIAESRLGMLVIKGEGMHIVQLNLEEGKMSIEGKIDSFQYVENKNAKMRQKGKGIMQRLLK